MTLRPLICAAVLTLALLLGACADEASSPAVPLTGIPFLTGTTSSYRTTFTEDSSGTVLMSFEDSVTVSVVTNTAAVNGMTGLTMLEARRKGTSTVYETVYYRCGTDTVSEVAYRFTFGAGNVGGLPAFPKSVHAAPLGALMTMPLAVRRWYAARHAADTTMVRNDPRVVYLFPLAEGKKWTSFLSPFKQTREVVGSEAVTVRAGSFQCLKIRCTVDSSLEFFDYVSSKGLILRTLQARVVVTDEQHPDGNGAFVNVTERLELIEQQ